MVKKFLRLLIGFALLAGAFVQADTIITAANFDITKNVIGGQYSIRQSGTYVLSTDIKIPVGRSNVPMIYIGASDVVLDLNGKSLSLSTTNFMPSAKGIAIGSSYRNIVIKNGAINGDGSNGARVLTGLYLQSANDNIVIDNMKITGCLQSGLWATSCKNVSITDSSFDSGGADSSLVVNDVYGIYASYCNGFLINNVSTSYNMGSGVTRGIALSVCANFSCSNIAAIGNKGIGIDANAAAGIYVESLSNSSFTSCLANSNSNRTYLGQGHCYGFLFKSSTNNRMLQCEANSNKGSILGVGIAMLSGSHNNTVEKSEAKNTIIVNTGAVYGILCDESYGITIKECNIWGGRAPEMSSYAYGIALKGVQSGRLENCVVGANRAYLGNGGQGTGSYGIALLNTCKSIDVIGNTIFYNPGRDKSFGFYDDAVPTTSFLRGNVAYGHGVAYNAGALTLVGDEGFSNFYFNYNNGNNPIDGIVEKNTLVQGYSASDTDSWKNYSIN